MTRLTVALCLALASGPALANVGPMFLPDLTFPEPVTAPKPETTTRDCSTLQGNICR